MDAAAVQLDGIIEQSTNKELILKALRAKERERHLHLVHLEKGRLKRSNKPAKTKRRGIGALRRDRRIRSIIRADRFSERFADKADARWYKLEEKRRAPEHRVIKLDSSAGLTSDPVQPRTARKDAAPRVIDLTESADVLPFWNIEQLREARNYLNTGFSILSGR